MTLKDVAEKTGCSVGAVSVVLNDRPSTIRVSPKTRARILATAKRIGYVPNYHAQSLHLKRSFTLGLVLSDEAHVRLANGYWAKYVAGVDQACRKHGYDLLFIGPNRDVGEIDRAILLARQSRVDALIVLGDAYRDPERKELDGLHFPVVYLQEHGATPHPAVLLDEAPATRAVLHQLRRQGHSEFSYVTPEEKAGEVRNHRLRMLRALSKEVGLAMSEVHLPVRLHWARNDTIDVPIAGCFSFVRDWLKRGPLPTAIGFHSDLLALGGLSALHMASVAVPARVSVFGFDDVRAVLATPPLSVVSLELNELGEAAVELALRMVEANYEIDALRGHRQTVLAKFVPRESIGPCRAT